MQLFETAQTAEQSVIGAIILEEKSLAKVIDIVSAEDFYFSDLKACYQTILELSSKGKPIDFVTVLNAVSTKEICKESELKRILLECTKLTSSISNVEQYAKIVANSAKARKLQGIGAKLSFDGISAENADETTDQVMSELFEVSSKKQAKKMENIGDVGLKQFESYTKDKSDNENRADTGFKKLDEILKGMSAGNLIILAARPKIGKTAFALSIAENVAKSGKTVAFFSLEMEATEIYERLLAKDSKVPMNTLIDRRFNDKKRPQKIRSDELSRITESIDSTYNLPIKINDNSTCTVNDICLECRMIKNLGLIVIDYLQLMRTTKKHDNRNLEVGAICRDLKCLASEFGVPILCLSQLNGTGNENSRPSPSEPRDSGSIEQDANKIILMWCVEKNLNELGQVASKTVGADVALNRRGTTGITFFDFNGNYMCFTELDRVYEESKQNHKE